MCTDYPSRNLRTSGAREELARRYATGYVDLWLRRGGRKNTLADFFAASPLGDSGLEIERSKD
jgi:hypothetical protein